MYKTIYNMNICIDIYSPHFTMTMTFRWSHIQHTMQNHMHIKLHILFS